MYGVTHSIHLHTLGIESFLRNTEAYSNPYTSQVPGYSVEMWEKSLLDYEFPYGPEWKKLFAEGKYRDPETSPPPWVEHRLSGDIILR